MENNTENFDLEAFLNEDAPCVFKVRTFLEIQERIDELRNKAFFFEGKTLDFILFEMKYLEKILWLYEIFEYKEDVITDFFCKEYMKTSRMAQGEAKSRYLKALSYLLSDTIRKQLDLQIESKKPAFFTQLEIV